MKKRKKKFCSHFVLLHKYLCAFTTDNVKLLVQLISVKLHDCIFNRHKLNIYIYKIIIIRTVHSMLIFQVEIKKKKKLH